MAIWLPRERPANRGENVMKPCSLHLQTMKGATTWTTCLQVVKREPLHWKVAGFPGSGEFEPCIAHQNRTQIHFPDSLGGAIGCLDEAHAPNLLFDIALAIPSCYRISCC